MTVKPAGSWTDTEDRTLRASVRAGLSPSETAKRLNRLEKSVTIRAKVIGCAFTVAVPS